MKTVGELFPNIANGGCGGDVHLVFIILGEIPGDVVVSSILKPGGNVRFAARRFSSNRPVSSGRCPYGISQAADA